jgi:hypothetical protein
MIRPVPVDASPLAWMLHTAPDGDGDAIARPVGVPEHVATLVVDEVVRTLELVEVRDDDEVVLVVV